MKKQFNEYEDEYYKFVWGVIAYDDLTSDHANLYTMNDIDIVYDKKDNYYFLSVETLYIFKEINGRCEYLKRLLDEFTQYMNENGLDTKGDLSLFFAVPEIKPRAKTIEELYTGFKIFVNGYCSLYEE